MINRFTFLLLIIFLVRPLIAQQIPNADFEGWSSALHPDGWADIESISGIPYNFASFKDSVDKVSGFASLKIVSDSIPGYSSYGVVTGIASTGTAILGGPDGVVYHGIPFSARPDTLIFSYKYTSPGVDTAYIAFDLDVSGDVFGPMHIGRRLMLDSNWSEVTIPLDQYYNNNKIPDTLLILILASNTDNAVKGSTLHIDGIRFGYNLTPTIIAANITALGSTTFCKGVGVTLQADSNTGYTFQWYYNGVYAMPGQTHSSCRADTSGIYSVIIDSAGVFGASQPIFVRSNNADTVALSVAICSGTGYNFQGQILTSPGRYAAQLTSSAGCDSFVTLNLQVLQVLNSTRHAAICQGEVYNFNGRQLNSAGIYYDTLNAVGGCDSIVKLTLQVHPIPVVTWPNNPDTVCDNTAPFTLSGALPAGGTYWGTGVTSNAFIPSVAGTGNFVIKYVYSNAGCSDSVTNILVVGPCSIVTDNVPLTPTFIKAFPNPCNDNLTIELNSNTGYDFELFDLGGRKIFAQRLGGTTNAINTKGLANGTYLFKLSSDEKGIYNHKLIVLK